MASHASTFSLSLSVHTERGTRTQQPVQGGSNTSRFLSFSLSLARALSLSACAGWVKHLSMRRARLPRPSSANQEGSLNKFAATLVSGSIAKRQLPLREVSNGDIHILLVSYPEKLTPSLWRCSSWSTYASGQLENRNPPVRGGEAKGKGISRWVLKVLPNAPPFVFVGACVVHWHRLKCFLFFA